MTTVDGRSRVLRAARKHWHRYDGVRALSQTFTLAVLVLVPLSGLARLDLWGGRHRLLFAPAIFEHALAGVIIGIAASYVVTFLSNVFAARIFCGWGCPVGQLSRLGEAAAWETRTRRRVLLEIQGAAYSALVVLAMLSWWTDLGVLALGSASALALSWGVIATGVALAWVHARFFRWEFCKQACPIGAYYSFVSPARWYGVHFRDSAALCIDCDTCDKACPVSLEPRRLALPIAARGGLSIGDAPGRNHCLECGDCVRACEMVLRRQRPDAPVPLLLGWFRGPQCQERNEGKAGRQAAA